ncbi:hypothetical protein ACN47E_009999 [Coniothyrium glycines]
MRNAEKQGKKAQDKGAHAQNQAQNSRTFFCGGGNVLQPNHITRYIYPSLCGKPKECLRVQAPANTTRRSRPQGSGSWGDGQHNFITVSNSRKASPADSKSVWDAWSLSERVSEATSENEERLGRAMARVTKYVGNTLLESGKFQLKKGGPLVYIVKRTTKLLLAGDMDGQFGTEEEMYTIPCEKWRSMIPPTYPGYEHDTWWMRLHCLYQASFDRAYFHVMENMEALGISLPIYPWYPRPDISKCATIFTERPQAHYEQLGDACLVCSDEWFTQTECACLLKCSHWLCLNCLTNQIDFKSGSGKIYPGETDPGTKFFRCPHCRDMTPTPRDRAAHIQPDELPFWRWKISMRRLEREVQDYWILRLQALQYDAWFSPHIDMHAWDANRQHSDVRVHVRPRDAVQFMRVPQAVWSMLPYGIRGDNPVHAKEARVLHACLETELEALASKKQLFNTEELVKHMKAVGEHAVKSRVVGSKADRLGNPEYPAGFLAYRDFLCEWTARGCFLSPVGRTELLEFMKKMDENKQRAWWKEEESVQFYP